jgi:UDP-N-acetylmuramoyl-tripeptide--D-alanyl-D-alanine ligase
MKKPLDRVAAVLGVTAESSVEITGWSIDSRTLQPGDLFFAIRGPRHDGHVYVADAFRKGAVAAVVDQAVALAANGRLLRVDDVVGSLQKLATEARRSWGGEVVGVTGSVGKTTTKEAIASMLAEGMETAKNEGNLNNHIGLPLALLRIPSGARAAVLEMGMNHAGEIRTLAAIAAPNVGVVTNVGWAHVENFDSIEGIAAAKRELIEALGPEGTAVLNADDPRVAAFAKAHPGRVVSYGLTAGADVRAEDVRYSPRTTGFRVGSAEFETALAGRHGVSTALAGIAVAGLYGISADQLVERVRDLRPGRMRGERLERRGIVIYNDCYNSSPDAARAMLEVLRDTPARRRIAVLGEMLELGHWAERLHRGVGDHAVRCGIDVLVGIRGAACYMLDAAKASGLRVDAAFFFDEPAEAGRFARSLAQPGDAILFKGSRAVHVELALEEFLA